MKCALEMTVAIAVNEENKRIEKERVESLAISQAIEEFVKNKLSRLDAFVEQALLDGKGIAEIMIDDDWVSTNVEGKNVSVKGFVKFVEKSYRCKHYGCPYWSNERLSAPSFPLDFYVDYLRQHCYDVRIEKHPFTAYSSSGASCMTLPGITLYITIPTPPPCV
jgi:hypothetical protein